MGSLTVATLCRNGLGTVSPGEAFQVLDEPAHCFRAEGAVRHELKVGQVWEERTVVVGEFLVEWWGVHARCYWLVGLLGFLGQRDWLWDALLRFSWLRGWGGNWWRLLGAHLAHHPRLPLLGGGWG